MPVKIAHIESESLAEALGWRVDDEIITINDRSIADAIDFRFYAADERLHVRLRREGRLIDEIVEKDASEPFGVDLHEFRIKTCGDDCIFCFVDQNPPGLRDALYFRDGDYRMSFLYGNYITMTNLRRRDLDRIVEQRLSPLYISVHCTDDHVRKKMMGHRTQNDELMDKLQFLRDNGIEMHTQIVLVPGFNDGEALSRTIRDLYGLADAIESVSIVPVGLTDHRSGLQPIRGLSRSEAADLIETVASWQRSFRDAIGRGFVYVSDEVFLLAETEFPSEDDYDGYPLMENGVGMCRDFLDELAFQQSEWPRTLSTPARLTLVTSVLPAPLMQERVAPALRRIDGLEVDVVVARNRLFGDSVTVSGLLNYRSIFPELSDRDNGDLVLLPPDSINFEGLFLDNRPGENSPEDLETALGVAVRVFEGDWMAVLSQLEALASRTNSP